MTSEERGNVPKAAPTAKGTNSEGVDTKATDAAYHAQNDNRKAQGEPQLLFEQKYRGDVWKFEVCTRGGRTYLNVRKWYWRDGDLSATKAGVTISLEGMEELERALTVWRRANSLSGLPRAS